MPASRRQNQKDATRQGLKRAALECFSQQGLAGTRVGDITRQAGTAAGTFYVHFASKDALWEELLRDFNAGLVGRLLPVWADDVQDFASRIHDSAEAFIAYWEEHRGFVELYVQRVAEGLSLAALRDGINPEAAGLVTAVLVEEARRRGGKLPDAALVGTGLLALWARVGLQVLFNSEMEKESAIDTLVRMTLGALSALLPSALEVTEAHYGGEV